MIQQLHFSIHFRLNRISSQHLYDNILTMSSQQTNQTVYNKKYRNHSNIVFGSLPANTRQNNPTAAFRTYSQIGNLFNQKVQSKQVSNGHHNGLYIYKNKIAQNNNQKTYKVPENQDPIFQRSNKNFTDFLSKKNKFMKPYSECTKYVDNLMKNKELLRRGQFDLPIQNQTITNQLAKSHLHQTKMTGRSIMKTQNTEFIHSRNNERKKHYQSIDAIRKKASKTSDQKNGFDKTLKSHFSSYRELMEKQRTSKNEVIHVKNSMNRILAAEMINHRLHTADPNNMVRPRSMKLDKNR